MICGLTINGQASQIIDKNGQVVPLNEVNDLFVALVDEQDIAISELKKGLINSGHEKGLETEFTTSYRSKITIGEALSRETARQDAKNEFPEHTDEIEKIQALDNIMNTLLGLAYDAGPGRRLTLNSEKDSNSPGYKAQILVNAAMKDHYIQGIKSRAFSPAEKLIRQHHRQDLVVKDGKIIDQSRGEEISREDFKDMQRELNRASRDIMDLLKEKYGQDALLEKETLNGNPISTFELFGLEDGEAILKRKFPEHAREIGQACELKRIRSDLIKVDSGLLLSDNNVSTPQSSLENQASLENPVV